MEAGVIEQFTMVIHVLGGLGLFLLGMVILTDGLRALREARCVRC